MDDTLTAGLGDLVERFDHVSVGVHDLRASLPLAQLLGGTLLDGGDVAYAHFRWIQFVLPGGARLEMISPLPDAPADNFLVRFLTDRGEGVHHVTIKVTDIEAAIERARELGFDVMGIDLSHDNWKEAFVHPKSASGVVVQIAEWTDLPPVDGITVEDILGGVPDRYT